jgi:hypothetical protein
MFSNAVDSDGGIHAARSSMQAAGVVEFSNAVVVPVGAKTVDII